MEQSVLDGRYRLERLLGTGGMGDVWLAEDMRLGRWVAVKWLREDSPGGLGRELGREARLIARLQHPNIVGVHDVGDAAGRPYLVMEYVHGVSLRELLDQRGGSLDEAEAVRYGAQVAEALAYAHEQGIYHSDIKPENILVNEEGVAKAVDFGIAQTVNRTLAPEEARGILGTIAYLAPEVIQGDAPDAASDVYSLSVTIFEMVAGRTPFAGNNPAVVASQRLAATAPPLRLHAPDASPGLESALARGLALKPAQRWASAKDFARALRQTRRSPTGRVAAAAVPPPVVHREPVRQLPRRPPTAPIPVRRHDGGGGGGSHAGMWAAVIIAGMLAVAAGVVAALVVGGGGDDDTDETPTLTPTPSQVAATATEATPTEAATATPTEEPTQTATATQTQTATPTATPTEEESPTPTPTLPSGVQTPGATPTPVPTQEETPAPD